MGFLKAAGVMFVVFLVVLLLCSLLSEDPKNPSFVGFMCPLVAVVLFLNCVYLLWKALESWLNNTESAWFPKPGTMEHTLQQQYATMSLAEQGNLKLEAMQGRMKHKGWKKHMRRLWWHTSSDASPSNCPSSTRTRRRPHAPN